LDPEDRRTPIPSTSIIHIQMVALSNLFGTKGVANKQTPRMLADKVLG
jgi:hypothetical protein